VEVTVVCSLVPEAYEGSEKGKSSEQSLKSFSSERGEYFF
jgi:hypothetical protein